MLTSSRIAAVAATLLALFTWSAPTDSYEEGLPVWHEQDFRQTLLMSLPGSDQPGEVELLQEAREPGSESWHESSVRADMNFRAWWGESAGRDRLALAGYTPDGELVIERWIVERPGAQVPDVGESPPIGASCAAPPLGFRIVELYRGRPEPRLIDFDYDFEGRFVLALMRDDEASYLYRFEARPGAEPRVLMDSRDLPELAAATSLGALRHAELGRVWILDDGFPYQTRILLVDANNDGEFDGDPLIGDEAFFEAAGLARWTDWDALLGPPR